MSNMKRYTIEKLKFSSGYGKAFEFFAEEAPNVEKIFEHRFDWMAFNFGSYVLDGHVWLCCRDGVPLGIMMARTFPSLWDGQTILKQDLLYCKKSSTRAPYLLMKEFVDFGRANASLIFTMTTKHTNVKEQSLQRLGFHKSEELYLLEV